MKRRLILLFALGLLAFAALTSGSADARTPVGTWHANRLDIYYLYGEVGIGTSQPNAIFHVANRLNGDDLLRVTPTGTEFGGLATFEDLVADNGTFTNLGATTGTFTDVIADTGTFDVVVITGGSDIAEPFDVSADAAVKPGMVVAIDPSQVGKLRIADQAYDRAVAGIVSGANGIATGMTLTQSGTVADGKHPVALTGRVWCWCDADAGGAITAGDMLTTSATAGHAMKAADVMKRSGAVLGKAMSSLAKGKGLVLVLVSLQ